MRYHDTILGTLGHTPLVRLNAVTQGLKPLILAKVEYFNPGGSVKDRIGVSLIEACEQDGRLKPGGTIVEPTSGNTGTGLAIAAALKGYRLICVMTDKVAEEKRSLLRAYGAEVVICPSIVSFDSPEHYQNVAARLAQEIPGACMPNQYANPANPLSHYRTTGPEIWDDTEGTVTVFVAGIGTTGTIVGTARYLKEKNPAITVVGADPAGSIFSGDEPRPYKVEGIGTDKFHANWDPSVVDEIIRIDDRTSFALTRTAGARGGHPLRRLSGHGAGGGAGIRERIERRRRNGGPVARHRARLSLEGLQRHLDAREWLLRGADAAVAGGRAGAQEPGRGGDSAGDRREAGRARGRRHRILPQVWHLAVAGPGWRQGGRLADRDPAPAAAGGGRAAEWPARERVAGSATADLCRNRRQCAKRTRSSRAGRPPSRSSARTACVASSPRAT